MRERKRKEERERGREREEGKKMEKYDMYEHISGRVLCVCTYISNNLIKSLNVCSKFDQHLYGSSMTIMCGQVKRSPVVL